MRTGEQVVVGFHLRRMQRGVVPMTKTWRIARSELRVARAIEGVLDRNQMRHRGMCIALPELTSVPVSDLANWLRSEAGHNQHAAEAEASHIVASTRGGRFDLVIQRLTALNIDHRRHIK
jgi:hypothetical protein